MIDPLSPLGAPARTLRPDPEMPDCFVAAAHEAFILPDDADGDAGLRDLLRSAH